MKKTPSIAIIICYMGKLPWYFDYFCLSCKFNPDIMFFVLTDNRDYDREIPDNVRLIYYSLEEINDLASVKLGFKTNITSPYKLCDFKPVYGLLFSELLSGFDHWGHGDIDIVYGDIRKFLTPEILINHDVIAVRDDFLTGYFLIFKNNEKCNHLFSMSKDFKKVLASSNHYCFDETNFEFAQFELGVHYSQIKSEIESMTHVVKRLAEEGTIKAYFDFHVIEGAYGKLYWNKGKLLYKNKFEVLLYHLIRFKNEYFPKSRPLLMPTSFRISPTRIYGEKYDKNR